MPVSLRWFKVLIMRILGTRCSQFHTNHCANCMTRRFRHYLMNTTPYCAALRRVCCGHDDSGGLLLHLQWLCDLWHALSLAGLALLMIAHLSPYGGWLTGSLILLSGFSFIRWIEHHLLYHPEEPPNARQWIDLPPRFHLHNYESVYFLSGGRYRIHGFFIKCNSPDSSVCPTILFFHGNAGNIGHRLMNIHILVEQCHANVLIIDYRGYGRSEGRPSEHGLYMDARASLAYLRTRTDIDQQKIVVFGRSLGGAVAIRLCAEEENSHSARRVSALIVENTFTSIPAMSKELFKLPLLRSIPDWFVYNQYNSLARIPTLSLPVLFISGQKDNLVPPQMMQKLYHACGSVNKHLAMFAAASHNDTWTSANYSQCIVAFLSKHSLTGGSDLMPCLSSKRSSSSMRNDEEEASHMCTISFDTR